MYLAPTKFTLINLICAIPLYLEFGIGLRKKKFGLLLPTFQERRTDADAESRKSKPK